MLKYIYNYVQIPTTKSIPVTFVAKAQEKFTPEDSEDHRGYHGKILCALCGKNDRGDYSI